MLAELARKAHHDEQCEADREKLRGEDGPVLDDPVEVAEVGLVMTPGPPVGRDPEGKPDEPDDAEPEHAEQHSGADRTGRRLAGKHGTAPRVDPQGREQRDLGQNPGDVEEALVPLRLVDESSSERLVDVDGRECQISRNVRREQQDGGDDQSGRDDDPERCSQKVSPGSACASGLTIGVGRPASTGAAYG